MGQSRRRRRLDNSHAEVRDAFKSLGWLVESTAALPGFIDMIAYHPATDRVVFVDAKTRHANGVVTKKTAAQERLVKDGWPIVFLESAEQVQEFCDASV